MILIWRKDHLSQKNRVFKTFISLLSYQFNNKDHKDFLESNKLPARSLKIPSLKASIDAICYTKKNSQ